VLRTDRGPRRDEAVISAIAIVGRGMLLLLLAHLGMVAAHWPSPGYDAVTAALALVVAWQTTTMFRRGPITRLTVPATEDAPVSS
jgi:hypothetical protein